LLALRAGKARYIYVISHGCRSRRETRLTFALSWTNCHTAKPTSPMPPAANTHFIFSSISSRAATAAGSSSLTLHEAVRHPAFAAGADQSIAATTTQATASDFIGCLKRLRCE
jgi:hypothetical protein